MTQTTDSHHSPTIDRTRERLLAEGAILCIRLNEGGEARLVDAARAAARGGLRAIEVTLTTPGALDAITALAADDELLVGAGTVLDSFDVAAVADAGACFALSPVFDPNVLDEARRRGLLAIPGAATPTEILTAHRYGAPFVKVFPSGELGGPAYLRRVRGPLPAVPLIPTSGPTAETLAEYFDAGASCVGIGPEVVADGFDVAAVEAAARRVRAAITAARGA